MPHFREFADVVRRAGIYGPLDYLKIVEEQLRYWGIEALSGLSAGGRAAYGMRGAGREGSGTPVFGCATGVVVPSSQPHTPCPP